MMELLEPDANRIGIKMSYNFFASVPEKKHHQMWEVHQWFYQPMN